VYKRQVLNCHSDKEKFGWYDYHHLTVYNAFLGVWLGFTDQLSTRETYPPIKDVLPEKIMMDYSEPTKTLKVLTSRYFAFFCGGAPEYLSEPSMTPQHIWFEDIGWVYSCPGGPSPDKFGRIHQIQNIEKNFFSPIAQLKNSQWILPAFKNPPQVHLKDHSVHMSLNYGPFTLTRYLEFKYDRIHFNDRLLFHNDDVLNEVRLFNFPVVIDKFDIHLKSNRSVDLISETGILNLQFHYLDFVSSEIELLETIETSKGLARVIVIRKNLFKPSKDLIQTISFSIQRD